jgi:hypothetical protein
MSGFPTTNYPTIVTMMYDIRKMENCTNERNRKLEGYIEFSKKFLLRLPYQLVIFISPDDTFTRDAILSTRIENDLLEKTFIYELDFKDTYFYKDLARLEELQKSFIIHNGDIKHETPLYVILNNNKFCFMERAIELNHFKSTHFIWMDFGINHVAIATDYIHKWITTVPDKIKQLCINPYIENIEPRQYFVNIHHNCAGGLFTGSAENMLKYIDLFKKKTEQIYNEGWYQIDEAVMTMVQRENLDLFDFFYGDYDGIISNYSIPVHSLWLVKTNLEKCTRLNNLRYLYNILVFVEDFYLNNQHLNNGELHTFINGSIKTNFIYNNNNLRDAVIQLINKKINENNESVKELIKNSKEQIERYENKNLLLCLDF